MSLPLTRLTFAISQFIEAKKAELLAQREAENTMQERMLGRGGPSVSHVKVRVTINLLNAGYYHI